MTIEFVFVQGDVIVHDRKNLTCESAASGLQLQLDGEYLVAASPTSSARLKVPNGGTLDLKPSSVLAISARKNDAKWIVRQADRVWGTAKFVVGRLWSLVDSDREWQAELRRPNAAVGIRG